ncbi:DNA topoisomerase 6 subunit A-like [Rosa sericea]
MADDFTEKFQNLHIRGDEKAATRADNKTDNIKHKFEHLKQEVESTITTTKPPHPLKEEVLPANEIIQLIQGIEGLSIFRGQPPADFPSIEATHKSTNEILEEVLDMLKKFIDSENYAIEVPSRGKQNQEFDEESESMKLMPKQYFFMQTDGQTQRYIYDIYYTNTTLYKNQQRISSDDLCCILRCHRYYLHLFATDKGVVLGNMKNIYNGKEVDCSSDEFGQPIPARTDLLTSMSTDDEDLAFVIVVEKHSVFMRLAQDLFWKKFKCIMITGSGMPDVGSRYFLRMAEMTFKRPVYALFDSNPYGARILCTYRYGSDNMSYDSKSLATPGIIWLGVRTKDLETYEIPQDDNPDKYRVKMTKTDYNECRCLLKAKYLVNNVEWRNELEAMLEAGTKTEIEALYVHGYKFLAEVYLPHKLQRLGMALQSIE